MYPCRLGIVIEPHEEYLAEVAEEVVHESKFCANNLNRIAEYSFMISSVTINEACTYRFDF